MKCSSPVNRLIDGKWVTVPCKQCIFCRINHTSEWSFRNALEVSEADKAAFITLTYDDEHLKTPSLVYKDLQDFWKNLRSRYDNRIRYFACAEYGSREAALRSNPDWNSSQGRPHFHAIVYGIGYEKEDRSKIFNSWKKCDPVRIMYGKGVAPVTIDDIRYVSGYTEKKLTGQKGKEAYLDNNLMPPKSFASRNPPIGANAFLKNIDNIRHYGCIFWNGTSIPIPEYFRRKYKDLIYNPRLEYEKVTKMMEKLELDFTPAERIQAVYRGLLQASYTDKLNEDADIRIQHHFAKEALKRSRRKL